MDKRELAKHLTYVLSPHGFKRAKSVWRRSTPYGALIIEIQGSRFGSKPYVNLGIWIGGIDPTSVDKAPRWLDCGIQGRLESVALDRPELLAFLFSDGASSETDQSIALAGKLVELLAERMPLQKAWKDGVFRRFLTTPEARLWLEQT